MPLAPAARDADAAGRARPPGRAGDRPARARARAPAAPAGSRKAVAAYREIVATSATRPRSPRRATTPAPPPNDLGATGEALADCREAGATGAAKRAAARRSPHAGHLGLALDSLGQSAEPSRRPRGAEIYRDAGDLEAQALTLSNLASLAIGRGDPGPRSSCSTRKSAWRGTTQAEPWRGSCAWWRPNARSRSSGSGAYREALVQRAQDRAGRRRSVAGGRARARRRRPYATWVIPGGAWAELERAASWWRRSGDRSAAPPSP